MKHPFHLDYYYNTIYHRNYPIGNLEKEVMPLKLIYSNAKVEKQCTSLREATIFFWRR